MPLTLRDLRGENALVIVAVGRLLRQLDRETGTRLREEYARRALSGDYATVCAVTEEYAVEHLRTTLRASEGDLTDKEEEE